METKTLYEKIKKYNFDSVLNVGYDYGKYFSTNDYYDYDENHNKSFNFSIKQFNISKDFIGSFIYNIFSITKKKYCYKATKEIFEYALDRLFRNYAKKHSDLIEIFSPKIERGYYGEEITSINLRDENFIRQFGTITEMDDTKLIEHVLISEYGYLLDRLEGCSYEIKTVPLKDIRIPNQDYYRKLDVDFVESYQDYWSFVAIVDEDLRLIDGYHRTQAAKNRGKEKVKILRAVR